VNTVAGLLHDWRQELAAISIYGGSLFWNYVEQNQKAGSQPALFFYTQKIAK